MRLCDRPPPVVILDGPTNYLDRDGLGALVHGLEYHQGNVVIISRSEEFCNNVCQQKWIVEAGRLREEAEIQVDGKIEAQAAHDEIHDESGNKIEAQAGRDKIYDESGNKIGAQAGLDEIYDESGNNI